MTQPSRIVLIGFSGSGKSTVAQLLAEHLGWQAHDTDAEIERQEGLTVPEIFAVRGEPDFRAIERAVLERALVAERTVIATGGGAVTDSSLWSERWLRSPGTLVVTLDVEPETVVLRLRRQQAEQGRAVERPMLAGTDPVARVRELKAARQEVYDRADLTLITENVSPQQLAAEIASLLPSSGSGVAPFLTLKAASSNSDIYIAPGLFEHAAGLVTERWPAARRAIVVSDESVAALYADWIVSGLQTAGITPTGITVPVGETSKSWRIAGEVIDRVLIERVERGDIVIALGGGVIGDLAGFVAAITLRGMPLVQIPTSLLAMVDSSIGGKTGINHETGKNLIGAFYQPPLVIIDPRLLRTLPSRELNAGWAEIVKHSLIQRSTPSGDRNDLLRFLERNLTGLRELREPALTYLIRRNVALKAAVVAADERESGIRAYLNFGHTLGHAIEAADYRLLHGEAVAVGIRAVMRMGRELRMVEESDVRRADALLDAFSLPAIATASPAAVLEKLSSDKKRASGRQRWVLPVAGGGVAIRDDVDPSVVESILGTVTVA